MSLKKYIGIIVVLLVLVGAVKQHDIDVPNQEIVLQFSDTQVGFLDAKAVIAIVEKELSQVGVHAFQVIENDVNILKITYYSDADIAVVKRLLTQRIRAELGSDHDDMPLGLPIDFDTVSYNIDVYEIQNGSGSNSGLNGLTYLELNHKADRFFKPKLVVPVLETYDEISQVFITVLRENQKYIAIAIQNTLKQIPEVRAGPLC